MPKAVAAEWFLRLFTTPDRAAAIAGDMSEEGRVSWFDLLRTAAALFFRNVAGAPFRLLLLLLCGAVVSVACWNLAIIPLGLHNFRRSGYCFLDAYYFAVLRRSDHWVFIAYYFAVNRILATSLVGSLLVRFAKGRVVTACLTYAIVSSAIPLAPMVMHARALWNAHLYSGWRLSLGMLSVSAFFLLASGVYTRKRFLTRV